MDEQPLQYAPPPQLPSYYPDPVPEVGTGWEEEEAMPKEAEVSWADQGLPVEEQRFEDSNKQDVYYSLPRSLQSQYFEIKENDFNS